MEWVNFQSSDTQTKLFNNIDKTNNSCHQQTCLRGIAVVIAGERYVTLKEKSKIRMHVILLSWLKVK